MLENTELISPASPDILLAVLWTLFRVAESIKEWLEGDTHPPKVLEQQGQFIQVELN